MKIADKYLSALGQALISDLWPKDLQEKLKSKFTNEFYIHLGRAVMSWLNGKEFKIDVKFFPLMPLRKEPKATEKDTKERLIKIQRETTEVAKYIDKNSSSANLPGEKFIENQFNKVREKHGLFGADAKLREQMAFFENKCLEKFSNPSEKFVSFLKYCPLASDVLFKKGKVDQDFSNIVRLFMRALKFLDTPGDFAKVNSYINEVHIELSASSSHKKMEYFSALRELYQSFYKMKQMLFEKKSVIPFKGKASYESLIMEIKNISKRLPICRKSIFSSEYKMKIFSPNARDEVELLESRLLRANSKVLNSIFGYFTASEFKEKCSDVQRLQFSPSFYVELDDLQDEDISINALHQNIKMLGFKVKEMELFPDADNSTGMMASDNGNKI